MVPYTGAVEWTKVGVTDLGVIYCTSTFSLRYDYDGYRYPTFWTGGYRTPTLQDTGEEFAVISGDLRRLNYTKTVFDGGSALDPAR